MAAELRPWPRNPAYRASDDGLIYRSDGTTVAQILAPSGYMKANVYDPVAGYRALRLVHVIVTEAFHGPRPPGLEAGHRDGNQVHNHASNLRWVTPEQNAADRAAHGRTVVGERHPKAKLTASAVRVIPEVYAGGRSMRSIALEYGVADNTIRQVVEGITWKHVI